MSLRLGIDVGGTNTDAVVLNERSELLASFKSPTTPDVTSGIRDALRGLVEAIRTWTSARSSTPCSGRRIAPTRFSSGVI